MINKKFKKWLSAYTLHYPRSITYMLQASEYKVLAYLKWWHRVDDFRFVEKRKSLVKTKNALIMLFFAWLINICTYLSILWILFSSELSFKYSLSFLILLLAPYILAYGILVPFFIMQYTYHKPRIYFLVKKRTAELAKHKGFKIGIAGSFGKTTMREILKTVILEGKKVTTPEKNYNTLVGISNFIEKLKGDEEVLIFELGEYYKGDIEEMCDFVKPELGVITGVNEAHLEKFKDLKNTTSTIFELADYLGSKPLYVNGENYLAKEKASEKHFIYSRDGLADLKILNSNTDLSGTFFTVSYKDKIYEFKSNLLGLHQIGPLLCAVHIALRLGLTIEQIQKGVSNTKPFDHRLEAKTDLNGVIILDDSYNGNPDGVKAVIEFLASIKGHRRFYVTPGLVEMGSRTEEVHREIGKILAQSDIEKVVLVKNSVTSYIEKGLKEFNYKGDIIWFDEGLKALNAIPHLTASGDVVLLQNDWPDQYY